jgi:hypothetical protein
MQEGDQDNPSCMAGWSGSRRLGRPSAGRTLKQRQIQRSSRREGIRAPMIQNSGMKIPMMNITQWPFRIEMMPKVMNNTNQIMPIMKRMVFSWLPASDDNPPPDKRIPD